MTNMLDAALALAARGFRVIPLHDPGPKGKRPRLHDWAAGATTNPETVRSWWTIWPNANVGAAMGGPERLIAIDVDGEEGRASWLALVAANKSAATLQSDSGSGKGHHLFFCVPQDISRITNRVRFRPGLDVRAEGGQVVLPPSVHESGGVYRWAPMYEDAPIAPLPDWLYELIATPVSDRIQSDQVSDRLPRTDPPLIDRIEAARQSVLALPPAISGQGGHNALLVAATTAYRGFDLPRAAAELVLDYYNRICAPPWSPAELAHKLTAVENNERVGEQWGYLLDVDDMSAALAPDEPPPTPSGAIVAAGVPWSHWAGELASPLVAPNWIVKDLQICPGRPTMIAGYGASGKTLIAQALLLAYAAGRPIWNMFDPGTMGGLRVRHFDHEQGTYATIRRYQRLAKGLEIPLGAPGIDLAVSCFPEIGLDLENAREAYVRACAGANLVLIDALRGAAPSEDENDSKIRRCIDNLGWVAERIGCAFILIHHAGKAVQTDMRAGPRGSSAIFDGCGAVFQINADDLSSPKQVVQTKPAAEAESGPMAPFQLSIEDGPESALLIRYRSFDAPTTPVEIFDAQISAVLEFLNANPGTPGRRVLEERMGLRHGRLAGAIDALLNEGRIVNRGTEKRPRLFTQEGDPGHLIVGDN